MSSKASEVKGGGAPTTTPSSSASGHFKTAGGKTIEIRDVWASNLEEEMENIREIVTKYPYVAMDTEFPGVVAHPVTEYGSTDAQYQTLKCNVDMLKLIQLGLTFTDENGSFVDGCTCWQFNFKFSLTDDVYAQDSVELLKTSGIDFAKFEELGIDIQRFGELLMMSGLVLNDDVKWITFSSSFDFGYLLKTLTGAELPTEEAAFMEIFKLYFPYSYDVKFMMMSVEGLYGGLSSLADTLEVARVGPMHQAGSDSMLTSQVYFQLMRRHFSTPQYDDARFCNELYGIGSNYTKFKKPYGSSTAAGGGGGGGAMSHSASTNSMYHGSSNNLAGDSGGSSLYQSNSSVE